MEHREVKTLEQIAELKKRSPGGYRNLRESVINELPEENYLERRQDFIDGKTKGMPGASLGVAVRMEMLPTPTTMDVGRSTLDAERAKELKVQLSLGGRIKSIMKTEENLLPTPIVRDYKDGQAAQTRDGVVSVDTVARAIFNSGEVLLPTLRASDGYERRNQKTMDKIAAEGGDLTMPTLARTTVDWGKFTPAIKRWAAVTRPAPAPTKPDGKDGNHRLSAEFTEWMMGLPQGWVTAEDIGLKRNDQLKACGNGVVPQQAELALRILLEGLEFESGGGR